MARFVWIRMLDGRAAPQLWSDDVRSMAKSSGPRILLDIQVDDDVLQADGALSALAVRYPCPQQKEE